MATSSLQLSNKQSGFARHLLLLGLIAGLSMLVIFKVSESRVAAASSIIKSGLVRSCLDDYKNNSTTGSKVVLWSCNDSAAQNWLVSGDKIKHKLACLSVQADGKAANTYIVASNCSDSPGQIWLRDNEGFFNPNSNMCLSAPRLREQLIILPCTSPLTPSQTWSVSSIGDNQNNSLGACKGSEGNLVACYAEKEWAVWQSGNISHNDLLNRYTDGTPYDAWCADFVSYVYKEAGYPFTQAYDGWDENNANNIQNYGFALHPASSGYIPKPGDMAYFDYNGGHIEIVIGGGKTPTFVYGNSATIDPTTGNGQMKANTIVNDGPEGQLVYYLSPN